MSKVDNLLDTYEITSADIGLIRELGQRAIPLLDDYVDEFYRWLSPLPEFRQYFADPRRLERVKAAQRKHWHQVFLAEVNDEYINSRETLGSSHAKIGLSLSTYFAGVSKSLSFFQGALDNDQAAERFHLQQIALTKLVHLETAVVVEAYSTVTQQKIEQQSRSLIEMSTPVTSIWDGVLMLPIVGILDSKRAQDLMHTVLAKIGNTRSKVIILDISGVAVVDTAVANHIIKITKASKLMGCSCIVSGLSPAIAQTIVELGIEVGSLTTTATLSDALATSLTQIGLKIVGE
ncbi:protoglobin domain-containing protein [Ferrimonas lipolytica]|uniref:STAS domain-containing protein n=1 Tax=Ferrimonas lipolytica TaxID=2724191 RepID=A0A6H1UIS0_9GAMM|nr:protoglobin domain-containing protein [Ferrimonas lipolytica]QIZ77692.1 STAS domain-containing protein [Ferrimonas lipolytica]